MRLWGQGGAHETVSGRSVASVSDPNTASTWFASRTATFTDPTVDQSIAARSEPKRADRVRAGHRRRRGRHLRRQFLSAMTRPSAGVIRLDADESGCRPSALGRVRPSILRREGLPWTCPRLAIGWRTYATGSPNSTARHTVTRSSRGTPRPSRRPTAMPSRPARQQPTSRRWRAHWRATGIHRPGFLTCRCAFRTERGWLFCGRRRVRRCSPTCSPCWRTWAFGSPTTGLSTSGQPGPNRSGSRSSS